MNIDIVTGFCLAGTCDFGSEILDDEAVWDRSGDGKECCEGEEGLKEMHGELYL